MLLRSKGHSIRFLDISEAFKIFRTKDVLGLILANSNGESIAVLGQGRSRIMDALNAYGSSSSEEDEATLPKKEALPPPRTNSKDCMNHWPKRYEVVPSRCSVLLELQKWESSVDQIMELELQSRMAMHQPPKS